MRVVTVDAADDPTQGMTPLEMATSLLSHLSQVYGDTPIGEACEERLQLMKLATPAAEKPDVLADWEEVTEGVRQYPALMDATGSDEGFHEEMVKAGDALSHELKATTREATEVIAGEIIKRQKAERELEAERKRKRFAHDALRKAQQRAEAAERALEVAEDRLLAMTTVSTIEAMRELSKGFLDDIAAAKEGKHE